MKHIMDTDTLDISQWAGKKQRLQTAIEYECQRLSEQDLLPFKIIMTPEQYDMLKKTPQMGIKGEWTYKEPKDRIYTSRCNCMEIAIK